MDFYGNRSETGSRLHPYSPGRGRYQECTNIAPFCTLLQECSRSVPKSSYFHFCSVNPCSVVHGCGISGIRCARIPHGSCTDLSSPPLRWLSAPPVEPSRRCFSGAIPAHSAHPCRDALPILMGTTRTCQNVTGCGRSGTYVGTTLGGLRIGLCGSVGTVGTHQKVTRNNGAVIPFCQKWQ